MQGHALTIKDEYLSQLIEICNHSSQGSFLSSSPELAYILPIPASHSERIFIAEEDLFVTSIDSSSIKSWEEFEYILAVIIENRLLQAY